MPEIKWNSLSEVNPERSYLVYAGYGERKSAWSFFSFIIRSNKISKQLETAKGLVGFTARLEFSGKKIVQLAVFEDENALKAFAQTGQHANCAQNTKSSLKWLKQTTWSIPGSDLPPKLNDAIKRIENVGRG